MYLHKIIESVALISHAMEQNPQVREISAGEIRDHAKNQIEILNQCVPYHFEDIETIQGMTNKDGELFTGEYGEGTRLPYKHCWFDFETNRLPDITLAGIAAHEIDDTAMYLEAFIKQTGADTWLPAGPNIYIGTGDVLKSVLDADRAKNLTGLEDVRIEKISDNLWISGGIFKSDMDYRNFDREFQENKKETMYLLRCFNAALLLLSCKNITTETVQAPAKLNKKRTKSGKPPIQDHHVLRLVLPKKQGQKSGQRSPGEGEWTQKPSFCSGHFKIYTADAPLFGRLTGRYWWEPHIRGGADPVKKQYIIIPRRK